ncbi:hypothetical protein [Dactylosporangium sp. CA-092794]|uniref:hypothetical protein n=1 Tax=Dactylosporangium sp. CA-092794 TaxID=3239929 RepID=UPI003D8E0FE0
MSQIENGDLDVNEVATLSRYARALGARMRISVERGIDRHGGDAYCRQSPGRTRKHGSCDE